MTAHAMQGDAERCLAAGKDGYISKPIRPDALIAEVARVTAPRETAAAPVDVEAAMARVEGDVALLAELTDGFVRDAPGQIEALRAAVAAGDARRVERVAHHLNGGASAIGAVGLVALATDLERAGREGCLERAPVLVEALSPELDEVARWASRDLVRTA